MIAITTKGPTCISRFVTRRFYGCENSTDQIEDFFAITLLYVAEANVSSIIHVV